MVVFTSCLLIIHLVDVVQGNSISISLFLQSTLLLPCTIILVYQPIGLRGVILCGIFVVGVDIEVAGAI